jgi:hypoxanthine phosphoribosyltransferase
VIPAVHLSHWWEVKMISIPWTTRDGMTSETKDIKPIVDLLLERKQILLVDDICDSGKTFDQIFRAAKDQVGQVNYDDNSLKSAALHYNVGQDVFDPDYYHVEINKTEDPSWIIYPWEA